jgi:hypothetical protein
MEQIDGQITDISGKNSKELYDSLDYNKWIKLIDINETIAFDNYDKKNLFIKVADIVLDDDKTPSNKKCRQTLIKFVPTISKDEYSNKKTEWLYAFVLNGKLVKLGGSRTGLLGRTSSYLCGHHIEERGKSGSCSNTNAFIYNTFLFYLELDCNIEMYGYKLPKSIAKIKILDEEIETIVQSYHIYEGKFIADFKKKYKIKPILCNNYDHDVE